MGGAKVSFIKGGMAKKPDTNYKSVSPGKFTKSSRNLKSKPASQPFAKVEDWYPATI